MPSPRGIILPKKKKKKKRCQFVIVLFFFSALHSEPFITPGASNVPFKSREQGGTALYLAATDTAQLHWAFAYTPIKVVIKIIVP